MGHFIPTNATATAEATARLFFDRIITIHGIPATLISDRDPKFTTCKDDVSHWDTQLPTLEFAYNNASHAATGKTPFFPCYGREPLTPQQPTTPAHVQAAHNFITTMQQLWEKTQRRLTTMQTSQKQYADRQRRDHSVAVGDQVLLDTRNLNLSHLPSKLRPRFCGPFLVEAHVTPVTFLLRLPDTWKLHNAFHVQLLKPYKDPNQQFQGWQLPPPPPVLVQDEPEYEVERVLTHRRRGGKTLEFLLRWKGYDPTEDSWVVEADMGNARRALKDYLILTDPLLIPIELSSSSELTEVSHDLGCADGEAADVEEVLQQGEAPIAERGDTEEEVQQPTPSAKFPPRRTTQGKRDAVRGGAKEGAAKERPKRAAHPRDFLKYERLGVPKALLVQEEEYEEEKGAEGEMEQICCFGVNLPREPASMEEALVGDDREAWLASREDEFQSHMENETWTLTNLPLGRKALDCMWVLRVKTDAEGRLERRKTRLVIKGFQQRERIDFQEVFAPVAKAPTLRLLRAAAAICGWKVEQMDVKTAFLYGVVDEEIYMKQPEGYDDGSGRVCRLNKAIYGLKQAPRLVEVLEALGFKVSGCDESLFMTEGEEEKVFLLVYVDDIFLFSPSLERIKEVHGKLKETFQCKALGPVGYFLGLHVERDEVKGWLRLHQHKYLAAMGEKYGLEEGRSVKTLLPSGFQLHLDEEEGEVLEYELEVAIYAVLEGVQ
ncbi:unnamed protein product [Closterium sp. NIES-54]